MSDDNIQPGAEQITPDDESIEQPEGKTFDESYVKKLRDEAAAYRVKLKEFEDRDKSELQKLQERAEAAEKQVEQFTAERERAALVAEVAEAENVPADALRGATREEIEAHAKVLKTLLKPKMPVIGNQAQSLSDSANDPKREFARGLFDQARKY